MNLLLFFSYKWKSVFFTYLYEPFFHGLIHPCVADMENYVFEHKVFAEWISPDISFQLPLLYLKVAERELNAFTLFSVFWKDSRCINWTYFLPLSNNICSFYIVLFSAQKVIMV